MLLRCSGPLLDHRPGPGVVLLSIANEKLSMAKQNRQVHSKALLETADALHVAAIQMLRRVRAEDRWTDLSGPRLSALSVIVFAGPVTVTRLAEAEQVRTPTISRLIADLEQEGLVKRVVNPEDKRVRLVSATEKGQRLLQQGRDRRIQKLATDLQMLSNSDRKILARAADILRNLPNSSDRE